MYHLVDLAGNKVEGKVYPSEVTPVTYDPDQFYEVERILDQKTEKGKEMVKVKWKGYNIGPHASWIPKSELRHLAPDQDITDVS